MAFTRRNMCLNLWDGRIVVHELPGGKRGQVYVGGGGLVHATVDPAEGKEPGAEGEEAVYAMLGWGRCEFRFFDRHDPVEKTIHTHWQHVLLEGARRLDEAQSKAATG